MDTVAEVEALKSTLDALELSVVRRAGGHRRGEAERLGVDPGLRHARRRWPPGTGPATVRLAAAVAEPVMEPVATALADGWLSTLEGPGRSNAPSTHCPEIRGSRLVAVQVLLADAKKLDATELRKVGRRRLSVVDPAGDERRDERAPTGSSAPRTWAGTEHHRRPGGRGLDRGALRDRGRRA